MFLVYLSVLFLVIMTAFTPAFKRFTSLFPSLCGKGKMCFRNNDINASFSTFSSAPNTFLETKCTRKVSNDKFSGNCICEYESDVTPNCLSGTSTVHGEHQLDEPSSSMTRFALCWHGTLKHRWRDLVHYYVIIANILSIYVKFKKIWPNF